MVCWKGALQEPNTVSNTHAHVVPPEKPNAQEVDSGMRWPEFTEAFKVFLEYNLLYLPI